MADLKFTEIELEEINKTIHTPGWIHIQKLFRHYEENAINELYVLSKEQNMFEQRGIAKTWRRARIEPYEFYQKQMRRKTK